MLPAITSQRCVHYQRGALCSIHSHLRWMSAIIHHLSLDSLGAVSPVCTVRPMCDFLLSPDSFLSRFQDEQGAGYDWPSEVQGSTPSPCSFSLSEEQNALTVSCLCDCLSNLCYWIISSFVAREHVLSHLVSFTYSPNETT